MRIALLSDIHSAADPYAQALSEARNEGFDRLIILGDLLTYGPDPERCIELTLEAVARDSATLILGNHDMLYRSGHGYDRSVPDWIRESVEWTRELIDEGALDALDWQERWSSGPLLVSHANPFGPGDWSYLRTTDDYVRAAEALVEQGFAYGVFGHVHREARHEGEGAAVFTVGSIGQPRSRDDQRPQWAMGELEGTSFSLTPRPLDYDWGGHCRAIQSTNMSQATREQLCRFYI